VRAEAITRVGLGVVLTSVLGLLLLAAPAAAAEDRCRAQGVQVTAPADVERAERSLLCLVNVHRAADGLRVLASEPDLAAAARAHSEDMVARGFFDHYDPDKRGPQDRAEAAGYSGGVGENIAWSSGDRSPLSFFTLWRESPGHNENMLREDYAVAGMGFAVGTPYRGDGLTGTQMFGLESTGADYIALDMLIPGECGPARVALRRAKAKLRKAKAEGSGVAAAKRKVKRKKRAVRRACNPDRF
jgi:uncharacterized protein YkwD